jgi:hypothetical protein
MTGARPTSGSKITSELEWIEDRLVFINENQYVVFWGINRFDLLELDPIVWQGVNCDPMEWHKEDDQHSRFLIAMWRWSMAGDQGNRLA